MDNNLENHYVPHSTDIHNQRILILDFGSQYTQLIARRVRECGVYSAIYAWDISEKEIAAFAPNGIILSGGPESVAKQNSPRAPNIVFELGCPVLGICYGMQTMAVQLGGEVASVHTNKEFGHAEIEMYGHSALLQHIEDRFSADNLSLLDVWMSHGDTVTKLPQGFHCIASSKNCAFAGIADEERHFYGLQFHPEVTHTHQGLRILENFLMTICGCTHLWTPKNILANSLQRLQEQLSEDKVLLGLSGGVDSSVVAALLHKTIGAQLICIFVDTGLLREGEGDQVMHTFEQHFGIRIIRINAEKQFLSALKGIIDPEEKRKIIGKLFIDIFQQEARKFPRIKWLAQGTIYPDVIESASGKTGKAHVIKSHHNVGGLPKDMPFSLIEPLRELFKDEVRKMGLELGLPYDTLYRHPFPGPGLGVRILGAIKPRYINILRRADKIFIDALKEYDLYDRVNQAFVVFLPIKSVGVGGDARKYAYVVALRAVETVDFMTAHAAELPHAFLREVSKRILNNVPDISRVVYDISDKPPATIEWE